MANQRILFDNGTDVNSVVKHNNPLPLGGGSIGSVSDAAATSGSASATMIALLKGILDKTTTKRPPLSAYAIAADGETEYFDDIVSTQLYTIRDYVGFVQTAAGSTWDIILDREPVPVPTQLTVVATGKNQTNNMLPQVDGTWTVTPVVGNPHRFTLVGSVYGDMEANGGVAYVPGTLVDASPVLQEMAEWGEEHGGMYVEMPPMAGLYLASGPFMVTENSIYECRNCFTFKAPLRDQTTRFNHSLETTNRRNSSKIVLRNLWVFDNRGGGAYQSGQHALDLGSEGTVDDVMQWIEFDGVHVRGSCGYGGSSQRDNSTTNFTKRNGSIKWCRGDTWDRKNSFSLNDSIDFENEVHDWPALGDQGTNLAQVHGEPDLFSVALVGSNTVNIFWRKHGWHTGDRIIVSNVTQGNGITIPSTPVAITIVDVDNFTITATGAALTTADWGNWDVQILKCTAVDGITTVIGEKYIEVARSTDSMCAIGEKATLAGGGTVRGVPTDGVWDVIFRNSAVIRLARMDASTGLPTGPVATSSGTGGGSSITFVCPHFSTGDRVIDTRSSRSGIRNVRTRGEFYGRNGIQLRGGTTEHANGDGGHYAQVSGYWFEDTSPVWIGAAGAGGSGIVVDSNGAFITDVHVDAPGGRIGIAVGARATGAQISNFSIDGPRTGIRLRGTKHQISKGKINNTSLFGISLYGNVVTSEQFLDLNPFTPFAIGDTRTTVHAVGHGVSSATVAAITGISATNPVEITTSGAHGLTTGLKAGVNSVVGMTQMNGRSGVLTVTAANRFTLPIDATGFTAYSSGGFVVNRRIAFSGQENGSGQTIININDGYYIAHYVDVDNVTIDVSENVIGSGGEANSTASYGGASTRAVYGEVPATTSGSVIEGIDFLHTDVANTATAIAHGDADNVDFPSERGRAADNFIRNCTVDGYATSLVDYDTTGILGSTGTSSTLYKDNIGLYSQLPIWTKLTLTGDFDGHPYALEFDGWVWGGGGGGGSGRKGTAGQASSGGIGGWGSVPVAFKLSASEVTLPIPYVIGAGGTGGASQTTNATNGNDGTAGGDTTLGTYVRGRGGFGGVGGTQGNTSNTNGFSAAQITGMYAAASANATGAIGSAPLAGPNGGGGGGTGGSITTANAEVAGIQASWAGYSDPALAAPTGPAAAGANGADGANSLLLDFAGYGGGGGGSSASGNAGNGGNGGRGSGGGGGGASRDSTGNSGAGGAGGSGQVSIRMIF